MHIQELILKCSKPPITSVPEWMLGCFKRRSITFATGQCDADTHVFWLQGRNITIDLRLPIEADQVSIKALEHYSPEELCTLANHEGWYAETVWKDELLSWQGGCSLQVHNRWPEPGIMHRVGDCMIEFCPSASYVEDWRLNNKQSGPLISLRLIEERERETGRLRHQDGALIICGNWAGLVLGRAEAVVSGSDRQLRDLVKTADIDALAKLFNFECSIAEGIVDSGFNVSYSTKPERLNTALLSLDGFNVDEKNGEILHHFEQEGIAIERRFSVDSIEAEHAFTPATPMQEESKRWFNYEEETLGRYLK